MPHNKKEKEGPHGWMIELPERKKAKKGFKIIAAVIVVTMAIALIVFVFSAFEEKKAERESLLKDCMGRSSYSTIASQREHCLGKY